jgi:hypothetical protein
MCIKDSINKTCWTNGNDLSNEAPKIKLWNRTKKRIFRFLPKIPQPMDEVEKFFLPISKSLDPLGVRDGLLYLEMCKKAKITAP